MRKFENKDYELFREPVALVPSPDGKHAVYTVKSMNVEKNSYERHIWLAAAGKKGSMQLTNGEGEWNPIWLDNRTVLFSTSRGMTSEKETVFYSISIDGGGSQPAVTVPLPNAQLYLLDNGDYLICADRDIKQKPETITDDWVEYDEYPFLCDGGGHVNRHRRSIYYMKRNSDSVKCITEEFMQTTPMFFSEDMLFTENGVCYAGYSYDRDAAGRTGLYFYNFDEEKTTELFCGNCYIFSMAKADDRVFFSCYALENTNKLATISIHSVSFEGGPSRIEAEPEWQLGYVGTGHGRLVFVEETHSRGELYEYLGNGRIENYHCGEVSVISAVPAEDRIYLIGRKPDHLPELFELAESGELIQLSDHFDWMENEFKFSKNEPVSVENEGFTVDGWVMKPSDYVPGKKYPAILNIHGGPHGYYSDAFVYEHQRWAAEGYFVFFCNPRGSTSYGKAFNDVTGDMGGRDYRDIMAFMDKVLEAYPQIDAERVAVTGQSYGGYMSNWIIGHTNRFAAACPRMSISNWVSMYGSSIEKWYADSCVGAQIWPDASAAWKLSPLKYADKVTTPTLFIQHELDQCCPKEQAIQMFVALCERNVPSKLLVNKGCGHGGRSVRQLHHDIDAMMAWFNEYLDERK